MRTKSLEIPEEMGSIIGILGWPKVYDNQCALAQAAITNYQRLGGLNNNLYSHDSGGWKSEIRVPAQSGS